MADYIRGNILAQSYVNLYEADYERIPVDEVHNDLDRRARELAARFFESEVSVTVSINRGSIITLTTIYVVGSIAAKIYHAIAEYGSFRSGVKSIVDDAKKFGKHQNESAKAIIIPYSGSLSHSEARTGFPGALKKIINELDYLSVNSRNLTSHDMAVRLGALGNRARALLDKVEGVEDREKLGTMLVNHVEEKFAPVRLAGSPVRERLIPAQRKKVLSQFILKLKDRQT